LLYGAPPGYVGYEEGGMLVNKVRQQPYSVVLFDEIEKAHASVYDIFLQIMDEGHIHDRLGKKGSFVDTIVIFTSNIGSEWIAQQFRSGRIPPSSELIEIMAGKFRPEFLGRLTEVVPFGPIREDIVARIFDIQMKKVYSLLEQKGIRLTVTEDARQYFARSGYSDRYGARPIASVIRSEIRRPMSRLLVSGRLQHGMEVELGLDESRKATWTIKGGAA
jgi:ATP-dependent Clp protease ATP-binding subunit ClpA